MSRAKQSLADQSLAYWNRIRGDHPVPRRADFDPSEIPQLLSSVIFFDVVDGGADFRYRVIGGAVRSAMFENYTGRLVTDAPHVSPDGEVMRNLRKAVRELVPVRTPVPYEGPLKEIEMRDQIILPLLGEDDAVTHLLLIVDLVDTRRKRPLSPMPNDLMRVP